MPPLYALDGPCNTTPLLPAMPRQFHSYLQGGGPIAIKSFFLKLPGITEPQGVSDESGRNVVIGYGPVMSVAAPGDPRAPEHVVLAAAAVEEVGAR